METGLVSVIIPTRNRPHYLRQAVDSVYAQDYAPIEIIVIGDGASKGTRDALRGYDSRLRYAEQPHAGAAAARNHGIGLARGEYVAFLDDDDLFLPAKLTQMVALLRRHPQAVWACSGFGFIDGAGNAIARPDIIPTAQAVTLHDIALFSFIHTSSVVATKTALTAAGGFPEGVTVSEDYHLWARLLTLGDGVALAQSLTRFRLHRGNTPLSWHRLWRENSRIIDHICLSGAKGLLPRAAYIENLDRIIGDSLLYKRHYPQYAAFRLWRAFTA